MNKYKKNITYVEKAGCGGIVLFIAAFFAIFYFLSLWTDNNLEFWLTYFKGEYISVPNWISAVITFLLNGFILVANIIAELLKLVV